MLPVKSIQRLRLKTEKNTFYKTDATHREFKTKYRYDFLQIK